MSEFLAYLASPFVLRALAALFFVAVNAAFSGAFAAFRNSTFLVTGASHAALGGAALIVLLQAYGTARDVHPIVGGAVFAIVLALLAGNASNRSSDRNVDTAIGVGFAMAMALAVLFMSLVPESASRVWGLVMGDLLLVTEDELWLLGGMTTIVVATFAVFRRQFLFITFDLEGARAFGVRAERYNYLLYGLIGLSSAILVKGIGAILVFAMLSAPAAAAMLVSRSVGQVMWLAFACAFGSGLAGITVSYFTSFSVSALSAFFAAAIYFGLRGWVWARFWNGASAASRDAES